MKIERLRVGLEVLNKVDGKEYKVTKVDGTIGTAWKYPRTLRPA